MVDPRLTSALTRQLETRSPDVDHVGWKLGLGDAERLSEHPAVGHLTAVTMVLSDGLYGGGGDDLRADCELAVELGIGGTLVGSKCLDG